MFAGVNGTQIKRGDIYFADLSGSVGSEQKGIRPVIILQNNIGNKYSPTLTVAPLTSHISKKRLPTHVGLVADEHGLPMDSVVMVEQIVTLDKSRLVKYLSKINDSHIIRKINNAILIQCGLTNQNGMPETVAA
jgi:mRNA interferase MazF